MAKLTLGKLLCLIGGAIAVIEGIIQIIGLNLFGIVTLIVGLVAVALTGVIKLGSLDLPWNGILIIVIAVCAFIGSGWVSGALILVAGILVIVDKDKPL